MMIYKLPAELFDQIRAYLATRPYQEVAGAMQFISGLQPIDDARAGMKETPGLNESVGA